MAKAKVIIVGAGAAGLVAASELSALCEVTLLECRNTVGGRIRTSVSGENVIEEGAEFVHGDTPVTNKLLNEAKLKPVKLTGKMLRKEGREWIEEEDMIEGWDDLVNTMKGQRKDTTMQEFLDKHYPAGKFDELRNHIRGFVEGFDVAGLDEVSVKALYEEWSNEGDQFRLKSGYGSLVDHLANKCQAAGCHLVLNETVRQIDWQKNNITVYTASGRKYHGEKVLVTVPVSVLKDIKGKASINFTPPVDEYINAARHIGFGTVIKVIFNLKEKLWKPGTGFIFSNEKIPTWWTQHPVNNNLITGWVGGPAAASMSQHADDELLTIALISLANIFNMPAEDIRNIVVNSYVFNWSKHDESLGAYSFSTPASQDARKLLNTPLAGTVYFAGEGLYDGPYSGTVEAALSSGLGVASVLLGSL